MQRPHFWSFNILSALWQQPAKCCSADPWLLLSAFTSSISCLSLTSLSHIHISIPEHFHTIVVCVHSFFKLFLLVLLLRHQHVHDFRNKLENRLVNMGKQHGRQLAGALAFCTWFSMFSFRAYKLKADSMMSERCLIRHRISFWLRWQV